MTVDWGLLSSARINRNIVEAARKSARAEVVAVASRASARAEAYARELEPASWGIR
jgi:predicted dehydrogenase